MNELEQFAGLLNSMDLEQETKDKLVNSFGNVQTSVNGLVSDLKTNLSLEREKTKPLKDTIRVFKEKLGLNEASTLEDLDTYIANQNKKNGETVNKEKYETDLGELRKLLTEKEQLANDNLSKFEDLQFRVNVEDKGLLKDFIDNPIIRKTLVEDLKAKLIFQNGQAFIKDENGNIQKNITTGEPLPVESIIESYKINPVYKDFVVNPIKGNGTGVQGSNNTNTSKAFAEMSEAERVALYKKDPAQFRALQNS